MASLMLLCAGFGTRLRPLTDCIPKPLVPIGDGPLLGHNLRTAMADGYAAAIANVHHLAPQFSAQALEVAKALGIRLALSEEAEILGTAGGVKAASEQLRGTSVIWNGDIFLKPPLRRLQAMGETHGICLLAAPSRGAGTLGVDSDGKVCRLRGHRFGPEAEQLDYVGVMALSAAWRERLPERGCLIGDLVLPGLLRGAAVPVLRHRGYWRDVGTPSQYLSANLEWATPHGGGFVAPTATIGKRVTLERCIVMSGARVSGSGVLKECVVCPDTNASAPAERFIVYPTGAIDVSPSLP